MNLPPIREDLRDFERAAGRSVDVIVRLRWGNDIHIGHYFYGLQEWRAGPWSNHAAPVVEWWPLPAAGTGTAVG